ncbi:CAP domain-containing protein [Paraburkholderia sp. RL17-337-BIB-A]|uniref:CAP domain-containing protein n=1 Tax=Paraburkholderia sp. RL17-337-BIB-A TaxID=3031636 RepID=UPI0038BC0486
MTTRSTFNFTSTAIAAAFFVAACGGGGGGSSTGTAAATGASAPASSTATGANVTTPQYLAGSAQLAAFNLLNQERQQCGFPALTENTQLDSAAGAHALYMGQNGGTITDTEVAGNAGFTGATYADRAAHFGYPTSTYAGGVSGGYYTYPALSNTQYGQNLVYAWLSGVYHIAIGVWPVTSVGVGFNQTTFNGAPVIQSSLSIANLQPMTTSGPLTFPCQGTTGIAYEGGGETPTPPNTSGAFGTPVAVAGNPTDTIALQSGTMTDTSGNVINLQLLDSASDPNKLLPAFEGVAYPTAPLAPNTVYVVSITGTVNGQAFSRSFSFTTGSFVG